MLVQFVRTVCVQGIHREQGSVHDLDHLAAAMVVADGDAVEFIAPAKSHHETAAANQKKENASLNV
jgi:hypothetical protein